MLMAIVLRSLFHASHLALGRRSPPDERLLYAIAVVVVFIGFEPEIPRGDAQQWLTAGAWLIGAAVVSLAVGRPVVWLYQAAKWCWSRVRGSAALSPARELYLRLANYPTAADRGESDELIVIVTIAIVGLGVLHEFPFVDGPLMRSSSRLGIPLLVTWLVFSLAIGMVSGVGAVWLARSLRRTSRQFWSQRHPYAPDRMTAVWQRLLSPFKERERAALTGVSIGIGWLIVFRLLPILLGGRAFTVHEVLGGLLGMLVILSVALWIWGVTDTFSELRERNFSADLP